MEIAESSTGRGGHGMLGFPGAAQPEVMRAAEKDEHYVASLSDACHEAFRHALGMSIGMPSLIFEGLGVMLTNCQPIF